jgi:hypothetical protein
MNAFMVRAFKAFACAMLVMEELLVLPHSARFYFAALHALISNVPDMESASTAAVLAARVGEGLCVKVKHVLATRCPSAITAELVATALVFAR